MMVTSPTSNSATVQEAKNPKSTLYSLYSSNRKIKNTAGLASIVQFFKVQTLLRVRLSFRSIDLVYMAAKVGLDEVEQILIRSDVKDIMRCKSVCKSWQSLISTTAFVQAHMNHHRSKTGDRRIGVKHMVTYDEGSFSCNWMYIFGSSNGLVCLSPIDLQLEVINPWTREVKKLHPPPCLHNGWVSMIRLAVECLGLGFGYDASTDDYKVIVGFGFRNMDGTLFHVLTLKSNTWKLIGGVNYRHLTTTSGILCDGALHWIMTDNNYRKKIIISLDLSTEEFKEIALPDEADDYYNHRLGIIEECLCIYFRIHTISNKKWVMKNNKWEVYNNNNERKYDVAHCLSGYPVVDSQNRTSYVFTHDDDGRLVPNDGPHVCDSMFVKSLVSPHPHKWQLEGNDAKRNIRKKKKNRKRKRKMSSKH